MQSPFPGMDPFIEACGMWEDFHSHLIESISVDLAEKAPSNYVVRTGERNFIVLVDAQGDQERRPFKPDVGVYSPSASQEGTQAGAAIATSAAVDDSTAVTLRALIAEEFRETFVEIYSLEPERRLVTCLEVLSPTNKRKASTGWDQYQRKRQALLLGEANLVEIDLLRGGERLPMIDPWPATPYYLLIARKNRAPYCRVWPAHYRRPLPAIGVPLDPPETDLALDLQPMIDAILARYRYERDIDYFKEMQSALSD